MLKFVKFRHLSPSLVRNAFMIVKNIAALIILSLVILFANDLVRMVLHEIVSLYSWFDSLLGQIFSSGQIGNSLKQLITIFILPGLITGIPAGIYYGIKKRPMPHILITFWAAWTVQAVAITLTSSSIF